MSWRSNVYRRTPVVAKASATGCCTLSSTANPIAAITIAATQARMKALIAILQQADSRNYYIGIGCPIANKRRAWPKKVTVSREADADLLEAPCRIGGQHG